MLHVFLNNPSETAPDELAPELAEVLVKPRHEVEVAEVGRSSDETCELAAFAVEADEGADHVVMLGAVAGRLPQEHASGVHEVEVRHVADEDHVAVLPLPPVLLHG